MRKFGWRELLADSDRACRYVDIRRTGVGPTEAAVAVGFTRHTTPLYALWAAWLGHDQLDPPKPSKIKGGGGEGDGEWREMLRFIRETYVVRAVTPEPSDVPNDAPQGDERLYDGPGVYVARQPTPGGTDAVITCGQSRDSAWRRGGRQAPVIMLWKVDPLHLDLVEHLMRDLFNGYGKNVIGQRDLWFESEVSDVLAKLRRYQDVIIPEEL